MKPIHLLPIAESGTVPITTDSFPPTLKENYEATVGFYKHIGFNPPWIGYLAVCDGAPVGLGSFKGPPRDGRVEIAYFTLAELEGQGFASATARELVRMAREADPAVVVAAQTLPAPNASHAILKKLGFTCQGLLMHPEDGEVWEWRLENN